MKFIYEQFGGTYHEDEHGYLLPDLAIPEEEMVLIGLWGQRRKSFLKEHSPTFYNELLLEGKLNRYLADIDEQAQSRYDLLVEQMKERKGITEQLKAESPWEWIGLMNNIAACGIADESGYSRSRLLMPLVMAAACRYLLASVQKFS